MKRALSKPMPILCFLVLIEVLLLTYAQNIFGFIISPVVLFIMSLLIALIPLLYFYNKQVNIPSLSFSINEKNTKIVVFLFLIGILLLMFFPRGGLLRIYQVFLVDKKYSDIIPTIQIMCNRLFNGNPIYVKIEDFGYYLPPTYLPMMWLPYTIAAYFHFDFRWIAFGIFLFCITTVILLFTSKKNKNSFFIMLYLFFFYSLIENKSDILGWTVEVMNGAFYTFLAIAIFSNKKYFIAIALAVCLLSRYALVFFVPVLLLVEWYKNNLKFTINIMVVSGVIVCVLMLLLVQNNWLDLYDGFKYYAISGLGEWNHLNDKGLPFHICNGNGFAAWTYFFKSGTIEDKFSFARQLQFVMVIAVSLMLMLVYYFIKQKISHIIYLLAAFKIYLAFFYGFIQVAYTYLFIVPLMYSIVFIYMINSIYQYNNCSEFATK